MTRHVFLSPHLDDVVLSCGGALASLVRSRATICVIDIFAGIPNPSQPVSAFARYQHHQWAGTGDATPAIPGRGAARSLRRWESEPLNGAQSDIIYQLRRREDETALGYFGLTPVWLDFLDCIYRGDAERDNWYYTSDDDIFGSVHPAESRLPARIAGAVQTEINRLDASGAAAGPQETLLYAPLAVGHHVDHQLVFLAAIRLAKRGYSLYFYEDYPYAQRNPDDLAGTVQSRAQILSKPFEPALYFLSETDLGVKIGAIAAYASQLQVLFGGEGAMARQVRDYAHQVGKNQPAERLWTASVA